MDRALQSLADITALREKQQHNRLHGRVLYHLLSGELGDKTKQIAEHYLLGDRNLIWHVADDITTSTLVVSSNFVPELLALIRHPHGRPDAASTLALLRECFN